MVCLTLLNTTWGQTEEVRRMEKGDVTGSLQQVDGTPRKIANVHVFVCDAATGHPIVAETGKPVGPDQLVLDLKKMLFTSTDNDGRFAFSDIPAGEYRLVAQKWQGVDQVCWMKDPDRPLEIHGQCRVDVDAIRTAQVVIQPLGESKLTIGTTPDEGNAFLVISLKPMLGEGILGFWGWGKEFPRHAIGITHMHRGTIDILGLPDNVDVHLSLINYDNNPGTGGGRAKTGRDAVATIRVYASWSNGYYQTPEHMVPLVTAIEKEDKDLFDWLQPGSGDLKTVDGNLDRLALIDWINTHGSDMVEVGSLGKQRLVDVFAAISYLRVRQLHEARMSRDRKEKSSPRDSRDRW